MKLLLHLVVMLSLAFSVTAPVWLPLSSGADRTAEFAKKKCKGKKSKRGKRGKGKRKKSIKIDASSGKFTPMTSQKGAAKKLKKLSDIGEEAIGGAIPKIPGQAKSEAALKAMKKSGVGFKKPRRK